MNTDVGGVGVRLSFYLQSLLVGERILFWHCRLSRSLTRKLGVLAALSRDFDEISTSLQTLFMTNLSMTVTTFTLGFKKNPNLTLQE